MPNYKILAIAIFSASLAACAAPQKSFSPERSLALNLAEAGGIKHLEDQELSREDYTRIHSSGANAVANIGWAAASFSSPAPGISGGWGLGLGLLSMVRSTNTPAKHRQLVAWMPQDMAEDPSEAQTKMRDIAQDALDKTLLELGWDRSEFEKSRREDNIIVATTFRLPDPDECPDSSAPMSEQCVVGIYVQTPSVAEWSPHFLGHNSRPTYFFKADAIYNGYASVVGRGHKGVDIQRFYATLSKHMPDWSYLYIPPKSSMKANSEGNLDYPQLYYRGKMELFATVKK